VLNEEKLKTNKEEGKMKKVMVAVGCMAMTFAVSTVSFGIELAPQAAGTLKSGLASAYVKDVQADKVIYNEAATAYRPTEWDVIMKAYGLTLDESKVSSLPKGYATSQAGKTEFLTPATAFSPEGYHAIFTSYGLQLDTACIQGTIGKTPYALKVEGDKATLSDKATAFRGSEYAAILKCYNLPAKPVVQKAVEPPTAWVLASDYLFDFDKAVVKKQYYSKLDEIAATIKKDPKLKVEVQGHTDSIGSEKYNMGLSKRRANAVKDYLIKKGGVPANQLTAVGFGESKPIAPNTTKEGRAKNRRVELQPMK
jgi:outer membrane protein OmpA-like peptidoglycan-associated protein